jgi:RNA polymerase sigma factor (sigma-70 family)
MDDATDMDLLRQYADRNSETAFAALVSRHLNLVYSAALRKTGNPAAAEEITQAVFVILAQKAGHIPDETILPGWLYQTARLTAASFLKSEARRARREQEAYMQTELRATAPDETWEQLAPLLEDAMGQLGEKERAAVVLRFFGGKIRDSRGDYQRGGGQRFNFNPHQRSIENYGMDKSKNSNRRRCGGCVDRWHNNHCVFPQPRAFY